jgi:hypothetical protein
MSRLPGVLGRTDDSPDPSGAAASAPSPPRGQRELLAKRDRLTERLTAMQLDLGGVYYEMAVRDHVRPEILTRKAAEMQRVDAELRQVDQLLEGGGSVGGQCSDCGAVSAQPAAFCWQCGASMTVGLGRPSGS